MRAVLLLIAAALSPVTFAQPAGTAANFQGHGFNNTIFTCGPAFTPVSKPPGGLPPGPTTQGSVSLTANCDNGSVEVTLNMSSNPAAITVAASPDRSGVYPVTPSVVMTFQITAKFSTPKTGSFLAHLNLISNGVGSFRCNMSDGTFQFNQTATITGPGSSTLSTSQTCTLPALGPDGSPPSRYYASDFNWEADLSAFHTFGVSTVTDYRAVDLSGIHYVYYAPAPVLSTITSISPSVASNSPTMPYASANSPNALEVTIKGAKFPTSGASISLGDIQVGSYVLGDPNSIPLKLGGFANLPEGDRDLIIKDSAGNEVARLPKAFFVSSLGVELEVNQGVPMSCTTAAPCIAEHDTVIRAKLVCNGRTQGAAPCETGKNAVVGRLFVSDKNGFTARSPLKTDNPVEVRPVNAPSDAHSIEMRGAGFDTLNFYLTDSEKNQLGAAGQYKFEVEINARQPLTYPGGANLDKDRSLIVSIGDQTFFTSNVSPDHAIGWTRVRQAKGKVSIAAMVDTQDAATNTPDVILGYFEMLYAAYPASRSAISVKVEPAPISFTQTPKAPNPNADPKIDDANDALEDADYARVQKALRAWLDNNAARGTPPYTHVFYFASRAYQPGLSECGTQGYWRCKARDSIVQLRGINTDGSVPHELGHNFDFGDTYPPPNTPNTNLNPSDNPLCAALADGCPVEEGNFDTVQRNPGQFPSGSTPDPVRRTVSVAVSPTDPAFRMVQKRDFMGNADRRFRWVDRRTWNILYPLFNDVASSKSNGADLKAARTGIQAEGDIVNLVTIRGAINQDGTGSLLPFVRARGAAPSTAAAGTNPPGGAYTLEIQDGAGHALYSSSFDPLFNEVHRTRPLQTSYFSEQVVLPDGAARFALKKDGTEIAARTISANPPTVQIVQPATGAALDNRVTTQWSGFDADGDPLTYSLFYSTDDGQSWVPLAAELSDTSFDWDTKLSPGSSKAALMVVASDGFHEATAVSNGLTVAQKGPYVTITNPADGAIVSASQPVELMVSAYDSQDRELPADAFTWRSDRDGLLGQGQSVTVDSLTPGKHTITLRAANSAGLATTASVTITNRAAAPQVQVSPSSVDFGNVAAGSAKDAQVSIGNTGDAPLVVNRVSVAGNGFSVVDPQAPVTVAAGASAAVTVTFRPAAAGAQSGVLTIASNDPASATINVNLTGTGTASGPAPAPAIDVNPTTLDFSSVASGQTKDLTLTVRNNGTAGLTVNSATISNPRFSIVSPSTPFNVAAGASQTVGVRFAPAAAGSQTGTLTLASNDPTKPNVTVNLTGTSPATGGSVSATLSVDDSVFEQVVGTASGAPAVYFLNRLTPAAYPATLKSVQIMFMNLPNTLKTGDAIRVLIGTNPGGSGNINNIRLIGAATIVGAVGQFNSYDTPVTTIQSGDFVLGFTSANPPNVFPAALDTTPPNRQRSYVSLDGVSFQLLDTGNLGIRAVVDSGPAGSSVIHPNAESLVFEPLPHARQ